MWFGAVFDRGALCGVIGTRRGMLIGLVAVFLLGFSVMSFHLELLQRSSHS